MFERLKPNCKKGEKFKVTKSETQVLKSICKCMKPLNEQK